MVIAALESQNHCPVIGLDFGALGSMKKIESFFRIVDDIIEIVQCGTHYGDK